MVQKSPSAANCAVSADKLGNIVIRIQAKPGAKQNAVTGLSLQNTVHALCFRMWCHIRQWVLLEPGTVLQGVTSQKTVM
jgi:hypothetical protein